MSHRRPVRRSQMVVPFGVGAIMVDTDGVSLISTGLDHWYERDLQSATVSDINIEQYKIYEWRLQNLLGVDHFRLPPDYRERRNGQDNTNTELKVPFLRFPQWHMCTYCKVMSWQPLTARGKIECQDCLDRGIRRKYLVQVPFAALCQAGHMQDFLWREWVHREDNPRCKKPLRLISTGLSSLAGQKISCDCGAQRLLLGLINADLQSRTPVSEDGMIESMRPYRCLGHKPWLSEVGPASVPCSAALRVSPLSASNIYYAHIRTSLYLPPSLGDDVPAPLFETLEQQPLRQLVEFGRSANLEAASIIELLRGQQPQLVAEWADDQLKKALSPASQNTVREYDSLLGDTTENAFRRQEYNILGANRDGDVAVREVDISRYDNSVARYFDRITLVTSVRETRALVGFTRIQAENTQKPDELYSMMWKSPPLDKRWLPAYTVYGEGIFLQFNEQLLRQWEVQSGIAERARPLIARYEEVQSRRGFSAEPRHSRYLLIHTFAHLLINRLAFECGYSAASLRERLFVSDNPLGRMGGVLIYTASGDSDGTLGGLVRMGRPGVLEPTILRAVSEAIWCSSDPTCSEIGRTLGQGPESCNIAACHNCALVPETSCEDFNKFLDRGTLVGDTMVPTMGYFAEMVLGRS